jgi:AcrR family transcriptional regulator
MIDVKTPAAQPLPEKEPARSAGRPRDNELDTRIFAAALEIARTEGYARVSIERVAATAGIAKTSIYRRYRSRGEIVAEALVMESQSRFMAPEGCLMELGAYMKAIVAAAGGDARALLQGMMADAQLDETFRQQFRDRFIKPRRRMLAQIIRDATPRPVAEAALEMTLDLVLGALWYRLLAGHEPLDTAFGAELVASIKKLI